MSEEDSQPVRWRTPSRGLESESKTTRVTETVSGSNWGEWNQLGGGRQRSHPAHKNSPFSPAPAKRTEDDAAGEEGVEAQRRRGQEKMLRDGLSTSWIQATKPIWPHKGQRASKGAADFSPQLSKWPSARRRDEEAQEHEEQILSEGLSSSRPTVASHSKVHACVRAHKPLPFSNVKVWTLGHVCVWCGCCPCTRNKDMRIGIIFSSPAHFLAS